MPSATRSIRAPDAAFWARAEAAARAAGTNVNGWVLRLMRDSMGEEASARPDVGKAPPAAAAKVAKAAEAVRSAEARQAEGDGLTYGYVRPAPGARLKGANRQPRR